MSSLSASPTSDRMLYTSLGKSQLSRPKARVARRAAPSAEPRGRRPTVRRHQRRCAAVGGGSGRQQPRGVHVLSSAVHATRVILAAEPHQ